MKVGDMLYCYKSVIRSVPWFTKGKYYEIIELNNHYLVLIDDEGQRNEVSFKKTNEYTRYFPELFYTEKDMRKQKILKINDASN